MTNDTPEFWEKHFSAKQEMWGMRPAASAIAARDLFVQHRVQHVLVPGIGYGRNGQVFRDSGMAVTGIEISQTAIALARKHYGDEMMLYHGSVTDMPFDDKQYDGIFCHALIHLLDAQERVKLVHNCYAQLSPGGYMIFTMITKAAATYGKGNLISEDRYELHAGAQMFFYGKNSVEQEFGASGLVEVRDITEQFPFYFVVCKKQ